MKIFKKLLSLVFAFSTLGLSSCKKENLPKGFQTNDGIITGFDQRKCAFCGGLMITFSTDPKPYSTDFRLINNAAPDLGITEGDNFPIYVNVDWKEDTLDIGRRIMISRLSRK